MQNRTTRYGSILAVLLMMILAACGGGASTTSSTTSSGGPADVVKAFFDAALQGNDVTSMICTSNAAAAESIKQGMDALKTALTTGGAELDTSGLTYTVKSESGDKAEVEVAGKLKLTVSGTATEQDYPPSTIPATKENNAWKVCG
jgi:hypothetical protein